MTTSRLLTRRDRRRSGAIIGGAAVLSAAAVSALVFTATNAAFTATTGNAGNSFAAGTVSLDDDDFGVTNFNVTNMVPGDTASDCIEIEYTGSIVGADLSGLRLYGASSGVLLPELDLTVVHDGAGSTCGAAPAAPVAVYSGDLGALGSSYATGSDGFVPTAQNETVAYYFDVTLPANASNGVQGEGATASFTWEVTT